MDYFIMIRIDPHSFSENFISEDYFKSQARARGFELGVNDSTPGAGAFLRFLAFSLQAQSAHSSHCSTGNHNETIFS